MIFPKTPSFSLKNKRALVTGAGRGIGMGAAIALSSAGAEVLMVSRTTRELEIIDNYLRGLGHKCSYKSLDVTDEKAVSKLITKPMKEKLKYDAMQLNFLKKTSRAKLPL